ncbi:receptor-like protein kinase FERONIA [Camellia sinensis]|uniref:receptor-like protein kinase FERONIA n=1 Tax=Camellia sinensis TaxID=4442 RepID=UPI00103630A9|nr:receptor-like protein kinase FERONIA [Camellia sinensis]
MAWVDVGQNTASVAVVWADGVLDDVGKIYVVTKLQQEIVMVHGSKKCGSGVKHYCIENGTLAAHLYKINTSGNICHISWEQKLNICIGVAYGFFGTHISTDVKGTIVYLDPEYFMTRRLIKKSNAYAFDVVLLEVLYGRLAVDMKLEEEQCSLAQWAQHCIKKEKLGQIIDPSMRDQISPYCLKVFAKIANKCLHNHPNGYRTMVDVVVSLKCALAT